MFSNFIVLGGSKKAAILISLIIVVTIVDSQFVNLFYSTDFGNPSNFHLILFTAFVATAFIINSILLIFVKSNDIQARISRPSLFRVTYLGTIGVQYTILLIVLITISEMVILHHYNKELSLLITYLSHFWSAAVLGVLSFIFIQWLRFTKSFSILVYGIVFSVIIFLILLTIPLLTEQVINQSQLIYPRQYATVVEDLIAPSPDVAFIYGLGDYVLPVMIISSWILTVSLLKPYTVRLGKLKFWLIVAIPLLYE